MCERNGKTSRRQIVARVHRFRFVCERIEKEEEEAIFFSRVCFFLLLYRVYPPNIPFSLSSIDHRRRGTKLMLIPGELIPPPHLEQRWLTRRA